MGSFRPSYCALSDRFAGVDKLGAFSTRAKLPTPSIQASFFPDLLQLPLHQSSTPDSFSPHGLIQPPGLNHPDHASISSFDTNTSLGCSRFTRSIYPSRAPHCVPNVGKS